MNTSPIDMLRTSARETTRLAEAIMSNPHMSSREFHEAFQARDVAYVQSQGYSEDQLAELRWETGCGCNGTDSPFHTYFGFESASDRAYQEDREMDDWSDRTANDQEDWEPDDYEGPVEDCFEPRRREEGDL